DGGAGGESDHMFSPGKQEEKNRQERNRRYKYGAIPHWQQSQQATAEDKAAVICGRLWASQISLRLLTCERRTDHTYEFFLPVPPECLSRSRGFAGANRL